MLISSKTHCRPAATSYSGTTGADVHRAVERKLSDLVGTDAKFWPALLADSVEYTGDLPRNARAVSLAKALDQLYEIRDTLDIPQELQDLPEVFWVNTADGMGKDLRTSAIAAALARRDLREAWTATISMMTSVDAKRDAIDIMTASPDIERSRHAPLRIHVAGLGGSTCVPVALQLIDSDLASGAQSLVILVGPKCGGTSDQHKSEFDCALSFLLSLQERAEQHPGRLWAFRFDSTDQSSRNWIIDEAAELVVSLLARHDGAELIRLLRDGNAAARRNCTSMQPGTFLCNVTSNRFCVPEKQLVRERAAQAIIDELEGGSENAA